MMESNTDDDVVFPYTGMAQRNSLYRESSQGYQDIDDSSHSSSSSIIWQYCISILDCFTGPNFGILVAVVVVLFIQFKSSAVNFFNNATEEGWQQALVDCSLGLRDLLRAYYQMAREAIRSFGLNGSKRPTRNMMMRSQGTMNGSTPPPLVIFPDDNSLHSARDHHPADARMNSLTKSSPQRAPSPSISSSSSSMPQPPLVQEEIEPAFLDEKDYPPGWLVYHPMLGVVSKEDADHFDKERSQATRKTTTT